MGSQPKKATNRKRSQVGGHTRARTARRTPNPLHGSTAAAQQWPLNAAAGRAAAMLHCFLIASRSGHVVYERFYERLSEYEKADVRAALQLASGNVALPDGEQESIGVYKCAAGGRAGGGRAMPAHAMPACIAMPACMAWPLRWGLRSAQPVGTCARAPPTRPTPRRSACFVFIPYGDLILYLMGSGEYDELACGCGAAGVWGAGENVRAAAQACTHARAGPRTPLARLPACTQARASCAPLPSCCGMC